MRNVAVGIMLISLAVYLFFFIFVSSVTACFWRNKDAYNCTPWAGVRSSMAEAKMTNAVNLYDNLSVCFCQRLCVRLIKLASKCVHSILVSMLQENWLQRQPELCGFPRTGTVHIMDVTVRRTTSAAGGPMTVDQSPTTSSMLCQSPRAVLATLTAWWCAARPSSEQRYYPLDTGCLLYTSPSPRD